MQFIKVPRSLILDKELGDKRIIALLSIAINGWSGKNYDTLVQQSLYSSRRTRGGVNNQFKGLVQHYINAGYLRKTNRGMVYIQPDEQHAIIYYNEFEQIMNLRKNCLRNGGRLNHGNILLLLAYVRLFMSHGEDTPRYYSNLLIRISNHTGLSGRAISICLRELESLEIIYSKELPRYKDRTGGWHANVRIFVNMRVCGTKPYDWKCEVEKGICHIRARKTA